jgi:hypothetical protein
MHNAPYFPLGYQGREGGLLTIKKDPVSWEITDGTLGTSGEYITSMEVSSMKTMSITKIALALLVSIPALSLNGAAVATTTVPSLWRSFCSKTEQLTSQAVSGIKSGVKAGFVGARNFVANHQTASKYSAIAAATSLVAFGAYKGYKYYQAKKAEPAIKAEKDKKAKEVEAATIAANRAAATQRFHGRRRR